jgi:hypothetical protein
MTLEPPGRERPPQSPKQRARRKEHEEADGGQNSMRDDLLLVRLPRLCIRGRVCLGRLRSAGGVRSGRRSCDIESVGAHVRVLGEGRRRVGGARTRLAECPDDVDLRCGRRLVKSTSGTDSRVEDGDLPGL